MTSTLDYVAGCKDYNVGATPATARLDIHFDPAGPARNNLGIVARLTEDMQKELGPLLHPTVSARSNHYRDRADPNDLTNDVYFLEPDLLDFKVSVIFNDHRERSERYGEWLSFNVPSNEYFNAEIFLRAFAEKHLREVSSK